MPAPPGAPDFVADPHEGSEVAARLDIEIIAHLDDGCSGCVHLLDDGRVLKITGSPGEAARALLLMEAQTAGGACPGFPRIDRVVAMRSAVEVGGTDYDIRYFAVVREEAGDLENGWQGGSDLFLWMLALGLLGEARQAGRPDVPDLGPAAHCAPHVEQAYDAIAWAARTLNFAIDDVRTSNFGLAAGRFVIRDFGPDDDATDVTALVARIETIPNRPAPLPFC